MHERNFTSAQNNYKNFTKYEACIMSLTTDYCDYSRDARRTLLRLHFAADNGPASHEARI